MVATINIFKFEDDRQAFFPQGQTIFQQGEPGKLMYVVQKGEVDIYVNGQLIEVAGPGGIIGEMALIDTAARSATTRAKSDCVLIPLDEVGFQYHIRRTPFFALQVMRVMTDRLRQMDAQFVGAPG